MTNLDHVCLLCMRETPSPRQVPCPYCGGDSSALPLCSPALPPRTVLDNRYVAGPTLGQGGFGITYHAYDLRMGNSVAIKEYFPTSLAGRDSSVSTAVSINAIKGDRAKDEYASGLRHFLFEARRQARLISSPGIVSVTDFFECNNTAYYVMEYVDGNTLVKYVRKPMPMEEVLRLMEPIADSLSSIHAAGLIHRDISPDNIMCAKNGQRKLLDFGASHSFTEEESTTGNATLKHGFAPPEQYGTSSMQGPWTDVYAFAATIYWCLTGKIPQDSMDRSIGGDHLRPPSELGAEITPEAEAVLMRGMALPVTARYQSMEAFWQKLKKGAAKRPAPVRAATPIPDPDGRTTVVPKVTGEEPMMEEPEHTKVPNLAEKPFRSGRFTSLSMERPTPTHSDIQVPVPTKEPETPSVSEAPSEPDITLYRPKVRPDAEPPVPIPDEPEPDAPQPEVPAVSDSTLPETPPSSTAQDVEPASKTGTTTKLHHRIIILALVLVIAVLLAFTVHLMNQSPVISGPDTSAATEPDAVVIAGTAYSLNTEELFLTTDTTYTGRYRKGKTFTKIPAFTAEDWDNLRQFTGLKRLSLVGCGLTSLSGIEDLNHLETLDVSVNALSSIDELEVLPHLSELYASDNNISSIPDLPGVSVLDLSRNSVSDLTPLKFMPRISSLSLKRNAVKNLSPIAGLTNMSYLDIGENQVDSLKALYEFSNLKLLYVDGNPLSDKELSDFSFHLSGCALDVDVMASIPDEVTIGGRSYSTSLTSLSLTSSGLKDGDIDNLRYMVNLTELDLQGNELSDFSSISRLYGLKKLDLRHNHISDLSFVAKLTALDTLRLSSNRITDLSALSNLHDLVELYAGNNDIRDLSPLSGLSSLKVLVICDFTADSLEPLHSISTLQELRISTDTYTQDQLNALKTAVPGCTINQYRSDGSLAKR